MVNLLTVILASLRPPIKLGLELATPGLESDNKSDELLTALTPSYGIIKSKEITNGQRQCIIIHGNK